MLIFTNPGLIDLNAITTLGASVKLPGSFGRFGTGLKYALATVLRAGGEVVLYRGGDQFQFTTQTVSIRETEFQKIIMYGPGDVNRFDLNITTQFGRDWQPWMVLRELGCNALDERGKFYHANPGTEEAAKADLVIADAESTTFVVKWPELDKCYLDEVTHLFLGARPGESGTSLWQDSSLRILPGPSLYLFYRGIRAFKLEHPSHFTYDILDEQLLTEDRTFYGEWQVQSLIRRHWLGEVKDRELVFRAVTVGSHLESSLKYTDDSYTKPTREFLDAVADAREQDKLRNDSAKSILLRSMRDESEDYVRGGQTVTKGAYNETLEWLFGQFDRIGVKFTNPDALDYSDETPIVLLAADQFPNPDMISMLESGRVYVNLDKLNQWQKSKEDVEALVESLLARWIELKAPTHDMEGAAKLVAPLLYNQMPDVKRRARWAEEEKEEAAAREAEEAQRRWFIITGVWTGYTADQRAVKHREETHDVKLADTVAAQHSIRFTDGTELELTVEEIGKDQVGKVDQMFQYKSLIRDCADLDCWVVDDLPAAKAARAKQIRESVRNPEVVRQVQEVASA